MNTPDLKHLSDAEIISITHDKSRSTLCATAMEELAARAIINPELLSAACAAISTDRSIGVHHVPLGWLAADRIYLSGQQQAIRRLLEEMASWEATEQEDLVRHWAGSYKLATLTSELQKQFGFVPRY